ncbi:hypothetical protein GCM10020331_001770 [Ectobacillus funiculus]
MCAFLDWCRCCNRTGNITIFTNSGLKGIIAACIFMTITGVATYFFYVEWAKRKKFENPYDVFRILLRKNG